MNQPPTRTENEVPGSFAKPKTGLSPLATRRVIPVPLGYKNFKIRVCYFSLTAPPCLQKDLDLVPKKRAQERDSEQSGQQGNQADTSPTKPAVSSLT